MLNLQFIKITGARVAAASPGRLVAEKWSRFGKRMYKHQVPSLCCGSQGRLQALVQLLRSVD